MYSEQENPFGNEKEKKQRKNFKKQKKTSWPLFMDLWPLFMDGVQLPQG